MPTRLDEADLRREMAALRLLPMAGPARGMGKPVVGRHDSDEIEMPHFFEALTFLIE